MLGANPSGNITKLTMLTSSVAVLSDTFRRQKSFFCLRCAWGGLITGLIPIGYFALEELCKTPLQMRTETLTISRLKKKIKKQHLTEVCLIANYDAKSWNLMIKKIAIPRRHTT